MHCAVQLSAAQAGGLSIPFSWPSHEAPCVLWLQLCAVDTNHMHGPGGLCKVNVNLLRRILKGHCKLRITGTTYGAGGSTTCVSCTSAVLVVERRMGSEHKKEDPRGRRCMHAAPSGSPEVVTRYALHTGSCCRRGVQPNRL